MADMICHKVNELLMSILRKFEVHVQPIFKVDKVEN